MGKHTNTYISPQPAGAATSVRLSPAPRTYTGRLLRRSLTRDSTTQTLTFLHSRLVPRQVCASRPHHAHTQGGSFGDRSPVTAPRGAARQVPPSRHSPVPRTYTGRLLRRSLARHSNRRGSATSATVAPLSRTTHIDRAAPSEIARPSQQHTGQRDNSTISATVALLPRVRVSLLTCASRAPRVA